jgi:predicted peroxiredoxin
MAVNMRELLIIETRDAADHKDPERMADLAIGMSKTGVPTTIFLAENGAFNARANGKSRFDAAISKGVRVADDRFALEERAIDEAALMDGISVGDIDLVVDRLADGACVMWR